MISTKTDIYIYAHWLGMKEPKIIGILSAQQAKGRKAFSFEYSNEWIQSNEQILLDPDIGWYKGQQYPIQKDNFDFFFDSMPDTWGRNLMKRRAIQNAKELGIASPNLYDIDFLLGVHDECRMGALRFKLNPNGPFLDNSLEATIPPLSRIREIQHAANVFESDEDKKDFNKWLNILMAPGSSLGGARPKANVLDQQNDLWIAKFPSKNDSIDKGAWEFLAYKLARDVGIEISTSRIERVTGKFHTFFTKRFDRLKNERIHFASAMTLTSNNEETIKEKTVSYLDIAEFIKFSCYQNKKDLNQLWKRIVFNISISNTDDHLRNHGFLLTNKGWTLSPAFDINPSIDKNGLSLNIDTHDNSLDFELAKSVGLYFQLSNNEMNVIIEEIKNAVKNWKTLAHGIGITKSDIEMMSSAFRY